jgi:hypothetical protein
MEIVRTNEYVLTVCYLYSGTVYKFCEYDKLVVVFVFLGLLYPKSILRIVRYPYRYSVLKRCLDALLLIQ